MTRRSRTPPQVSRLLVAPLVKAEARPSNEKGMGGKARVEEKARLHEGKGMGGSEALRCRRACAMHVTSIADLAR